MESDSAGPREHVSRPFQRGVPVDQTVATALIRVALHVNALSFFFALCCLGKIPGGAPFSQLHKSGNGSRVDRPCMSTHCLVAAWAGEGFS